MRMTFVALSARCVSTATHICMQGRAVAIML